jgi:hypothetical protein
LLSPKKAGCQACELEITDAGSKCLDRLSNASAKLFSKVESGEITGFVCATTITTVHYLARKVIGSDSAAREIRKLMKPFEIAPVNRGHGVLFEIWILGLGIYAISFYKRSQVGLKGTFRNIDDRWRSGGRYEIILVFHLRDGIATQRLFKIFFLGVLSELCGEFLKFF